MKRNKIIGILFFISLIFPGAFGASVEIGPDILYGSMPVTISYDGFEDEEDFFLAFQPTYVSEGDRFTGLMGDLELPFNSSDVAFFSIDGKYTEFSFDFVSGTLDPSGFDEGYLIFELIKNASNPGDEVTMAYLINGMKESGNQEDVIRMWPDFHPQKGVLHVIVNLGDNYYEKEIPYQQDVYVPYVELDDVTVQSGNSAIGDLYLYDLSQGISLYNVTISMEDPTIGHFTNAQLPSGFIGTPNIASNTIQVNATTSLEDPIYNVQILNITYLGLNQGSSQVNVTINRIIDGEGNDYPIGDDYSGKLTVTPPPPQQIDFIGTPTRGIVPFDVAFQYLPADSPVSFNWSFGDGTPNATVRNPVHTYWTSGSHDVTLTVDRISDNDTKTKTGYIESKQVPIWFKSNLTTGSAPLLVSFNGTTDKVSTNWKYSFGDGKNGNEPNMTHEYTTAGTYTVKATAEINGVIRSAIRYNYVKVT